MSHEDIQNGIDLVARTVDAVVPDNSTEMMELLADSPKLWDVTVFDGIPSNLTPLAILRAVVRDEVDDKVHDILDLAVEKSREKKAGLSIP